MLEPGAGLREAHRETSTQEVDYRQRLIRTIRPDGSLDPAHDPELTQRQLISVYSRMASARWLDERLMALQRQGRVGFHIGSSGEEATVLGAGFALDEHDWVFPSYREYAVALLRGMPLRQLLDHMVGNAGDLSKGRQMPSHYTYRAGRMISISSPVGTQLTQAVGFAWAAKLRRERCAVLTYFGEGTTSSAEFHTAMNFAGVVGAPTVFLCRNNGWAISTPAAAQTATRTFAEKSSAYAIPSMRCDGNDVLAMIWATRRALAAARRGEGPTFIEAVTYRLAGHSSSDEAQVYRSDEEVAVWRARDPVARCRGLLERNALWSRTRQEELERDLEAEFKSALEAAEQADAPDVDSMFDDVYANLPAHLLEQRRSLQRSQPQSNEDASHVE
jgi:2-oxoisovalerate dehydrogenase E1 component alpha subunit